MQNLYQGPIYHKSFIILVSCYVAEKPLGLLKHQGPSGTSTITILWLHSWSRYMGSFWGHMCRQPRIARISFTRSMGSAHCPSLVSKYPGHMSRRWSPNNYTPEYSSDFWYCFFKKKKLKNAPGTAAEIWTQNLLSSIKQSIKIQFPSLKISLRLYIFFPTEPEIMKIINTMIFFVINSWTRTSRKKTFYFQYPTS